MKNLHDTLRIKAQTGFSIVEIMVGLVIALFGIIIMFQVFSTSEGIKRTTTSGGDALQNGTAALFYMERSLKRAGYGLFSSNNISPYPADAVTTVPITITAGPANGSDTLLLKYRDNWYSGPFSPPVNIVGFSAPPPLTFETINVVATGNLTELTSTPILDPAPPYAVTATPAPASSVISEGIVLMKAEYGYDTNSDGVVDTWSHTPIAAPVLAVRTVIVARSAQPEVTRTSAGAITACATTTAFPTWTDSASIPLDLSANLGLAASDSWQCYRYKTFETTVAIQNDM